jgi:hypothetical protein
MNRKNVLDELTVLETVIDDLDGIETRTERDALRMQKWKAQLEVVQEVVKKTATASKSTEVIALAGACVILAEGIGELILERQGKPAAKKPEVKMFRTRLEARQGKPGTPYPKERP